MQSGNRFVFQGVTFGQAYANITHHQHGDGDAVSYQEGEEYGQAIYIPASGKYVFVISLQI
jgi:hypothetical protein